MNDMIPYPNWEEKYLEHLSSCAEYTLLYRNVYQPIKKHWVRRVKKTGEVRRVSHEVLYD
jgi:hypothetical protein